MLVLVKMLYYIILFGQISFPNVFDSPNVFEKRPNGFFPKEMPNCSVLFYTICLFNFSMEHIFVTTTDRKNPNQTFGPNASKWQTLYYALFTKIWLFPNGVMCNRILSSFHEFINNFHNFC